MMDETEQRPSRALPIGVSAGLAVAVFGVLFAIRGPGRAADVPADTPPVATTATDKPADQPPPDPQPVATTTPPATTTTPPAATPDAGKPAVAVAATPDATKPATVVAATPTDSSSTLATLTFVITPKEAAGKVDITVDKKPVLGDRFQVQKGGGPVKVVVRSPGFQIFEKEVLPSGDQQVAIELKKVEPVAATPAKTPPKEPTVAKTPPKEPTVARPRVKRPPKKPKVEL